MPTTTVLRPNALIGYTGTYSTDGGSAQDELSDDSDLTAVRMPAAYETPVASMQLGFTDIDLDTDRKIGYVQPWIRFVRFGAAAHAFGLAISREGVAWQTLLGTTNVPTSLRTDPGGSAAYDAFGVAWTEASVNELRMNMDLSSPAAPEDLFRVVVAELYLNVVHYARPTVAIASPADESTVTTSRPVIGWSPGLDGGPQYAYRVKVFTDATVNAGGFNPDTAQTYWDSGDVVSTATSATVPVDLTQGGTFHVYVRVAQFVAGAYWSEWDTHEFDVDVPEPTVEVTAPTGTSTATNALPTQWVTVDPSGMNRPQSRYQIKVFTDAVYGDGGFDPDSSTAAYDSGQVSGTAQEQLLPALPNDTYRVYVRAAMELVAGNRQWSDWDYSGFEIDVELPDPPTLTATADDETASIGISWTGSIDPDDLIEVQRSSDAGATWQPVRGFINGRTLFSDDGVDDYEASNGATVIYRARTVQLVSGQERISDWSAPTTPTGWESRSWWLKHPFDPSLNVAVDLVSFPSVDRPRSEQITDPVGRTDPIVLVGPRMKARARFVVDAPTSEIREAIDDLLDATAIVLAQGPESHDEPDRWISVGGTSHARLADRAAVHERNVVMPWTEVRRPEGDRV